MNTNRCRLIMMFLLALVPGVASAQFDVRITYGSVEPTEPAVCVGADGLARVVWAERISNVYRIRWAAVDLSGIIVHGPISVSSSGASHGRLPRIAVDGLDRSFIVWVENSRIFFSRLGTDGAQEVAPVIVSNSNGHSYPDIATTAAGISHITYQQRTFIHWLWYRRLAADGTVTAEHRTSDIDVFGYDKFPSIAMDAAGNAHVLWRDFDAYTQGLYRASYTGSGVLLMPRERIVIGGTLGWTALATAGGGQIYYLYQDGRYGLNQIFHFIGNDPGEPLSPPPGPSERPRIAAAPGQTTHIVWQDNYGGVWKIKGQSRQPDGTIIHSEYDVSHSTADATLPDVGTDGNGIYYYVWRDMRDGNPEIYLNVGIERGVEARVCVLGSEQPLAYATVSVVLDGVPLMVGYTDENGFCRISPLLPGEYAVRAEYAGMVGEHQLAVVPERGFVPVELEVATDIALYTKISDAFNGSGIEFAEVELYRQGDSAPVKVAVTNALGICQFNVTESGQYYVQAGKTGLIGTLPDPVALYAADVSGAVEIGEGPAQFALAPLELESQVVVLVHGVISHSGIWNEYAAALRQEGWSVLDGLDLPGTIPSYEPPSPRHGMAGIADQAVFLHQRTGAAGVRSFHVVSHSQGGLVTRYMMEVLHRGLPPRVNKLICLATPHHGTPVLGAMDLVISLFSPGIGPLDSWLTGSVLMGMIEESWPAARDLRHDSDLLRLLNQQRMNRRDWRGRCLFTPATELGLVPQSAYLTIAADGVEDKFWLAYLYLVTRQCLTNDGLVPRLSAKIHSSQHGQVRNYLASSDIGVVVHHKRWPHTDDGIVENSEVREFVLARLATDPAEWPVERQGRDLIPRRHIAQWAPMNSLRVAAMAGGAMADTVHVDHCDSLMVGWQWFAGDVNLALVTPSGTVIDSALAAVNPEIVFAKDPISLRGQYLIATPESGPYELLVTAPAQQEDQLTFVQIYGANAVGMEVIIEKADDAPFAPRTITAGLYDANGFPIVDGVVTADVSHPSGADEMIVLRDDGTGPDEFAGDGVYTAVVDVEPEFGVTTIMVEAAGGPGSEFRRRFPGVISVAPHSDVTIEPTGLEVESVYGAVGRRIGLTAGIRNHGPAAATIEASFWIDNHDVFVGADTLALAVGQVEFAGSSYMPLAAGEYEFLITMRALDGMDVADLTENTARATVLVGEATTSVPDGKPALPVPPGGEDIVSCLVAGINVAYPNPFNPVVQIRYSVAQKSRVVMDVFDLRGRRICRLLDDEHEPGEHTMSWHGVDDRGAQASSGVYLVRLVTSSGEQRTVKVTLSK